MNPSLMFAALAAFLLATISAEAAPSSSPPRQGVVRLPPSPPSPPLPTCEIAVSFTRGSQKVTQKTCDQLAAYLPKLYNAKLNFYCSGVADSAPSVTANLNQFAIAQKFIKSFKDIPESKLIFNKFNLVCRDTLTLISTCNNTQPIIHSPCNTRPPPPPPQACNITMTATKEEGGFTNSTCAMFGESLRRVYQTNLLFTCTNVSADGQTFKVTSFNNYFNQQYINYFFDSALHNDTRATELANLYKMQCVDYFLLESSCRSGGYVVPCKPPSPPPPPPVVRVAKPPPKPKSG